jgi:choline dehydrogenase-like flavoprotein
MLTDANNIPAGSEVETDVCIIGAGPAGIAAALPLLERKIHVTMLAGGGTDFTHSLKNPLQIVRGHLRGEQGLAAGKLIGHPYYPLRLTRARGFGGTANALKSHGLRSRPLDPLDFEARPELGLPGWPIRRADLDPYYERAQALCGLGPAQYGSEYWSRADSAPPLPADPDLVETTIFQHGPVEQFSSQRESFASNPDVEVMLRANATALRTDSAGNVDRVEVATLQGNRFVIRPNVVILATGAIENARLLLASRDHHPAGLGNQHDLAGRYFMEHPHLTVGTLRPTDPALTERLALYRLHNVSETLIQGFWRLPDEVLRREGLLNAALGVASVSDSSTSAWTRTVGRARWALTSGVMSPRLVKHAIASLGSELFRSPEAASQSAASAPRITIDVMAEQAPHRESRVSLGRKLDRLGMPITQLDWRVDDGDRNSLQRTVQLFDQALQDAGIGRIEQRYGDLQPPPIAKGGWHHMGTTRMHEDPKLGVVDAQSRVHGVHNLYVAGSSVFPSGGASNPTLTIVALALRLGEHLACEQRRPRHAITISA